MSEWVGMVGGARSCNWLARSFTRLTNQVEALNLAASHNAKEA